VPSSASSALDRVTTEIRRRLDTGTYPPGSDLPTSAALAAELGVSVGTVRQALTRLDSAGLTLSRQGRSRVVAVSGREPEATRPEQLAGALERAIAGGELPAGARLPAETALAAKQGVSRATARRALQLLEERGAAAARAGHRYVAGPTDVPDLAYERLAEDLRKRFGSRRRVAEQLPGEQALAAEYSVSRPTVRRALELLRDQGFVRSEPKVGWFTVPGATARRRADG